MTTSPSERDDDEPVIAEDVVHDPRQRDPDVTTDPDGWLQTAEPPD